MTTKNLLTRMKGYEEASRMILPGRSPVILRLDGKSFSTYTRSLGTFNHSFTWLMKETAVAVCKHIQGATFAYTQSDEISILIHSYKKLNSEPWFENCVQKMVSVSSSIAAVTFTLGSPHLFKDVLAEPRAEDARPAYFDARVFVVPENDVVNYFVWRQQDATRNAMSMWARSLFSAKEIHGKNWHQMREMCETHGVKWDALAPQFTRGTCISRIDGHWTIDDETPLFTTNRDYIARHLELEEGLRGAVIWPTRWPTYYP